MLKIFIDSITYFLLTKFNKKIISQRENPNSVPVIIINFNQLENLKNLVDALMLRKQNNIVIIDNNSDYPPLLNYYSELPEHIKIERMPQNQGHMVFFDNIELQNKYGQGYYFLTDADILPHPQMPDNFSEIMIAKMDKYIHKIQKIGFALELESIPTYYPLRSKVITWEEKYWTKPLEEDLYSARIDTTFALYKPQYPQKFKVKASKFYKAIRIAGNFTAKHMGWYIDPKNMSEEQKYYMKTSSSSNSWKFDDEGKLDSPSNY